MNRLVLLFKKERVSHVGLFHVTAIRKDGEGVNTGCDALDIDLYTTLFFKFISQNYSQQRMTYVIGDDPVEDQVGITWKYNNDSAQAISDTPMFYACPIWSDVLIHEHFKMFIEHQFGVFLHMLQQLFPSTELAHDFSVDTVVLRQGDIFGAIPDCIGTFTCKGDKITFK